MAAPNWRSTPNSCPTSLPMMIPAADFGERRLHAGICLDQPRQLLQIAPQFARLAHTCCCASRRMVAGRSTGSSAWPRMHPCRWPRAAGRPTRHTSVPAPPPSRHCPLAATAKRLATPPAAYPAACAASRSQRHRLQRRCLRPRNRQRAIQPAIRARSSPVRPTPCNPARRNASAKGQANPRRAQSPVAASPRDPLAVAAKRAARIARPGPTGPFGPLYPARRLNPDCRAAAPCTALSENGATMFNPSAAPRWKITTRVLCLLLGRGSRPCQP